MDHSEDYQEQNVYICVCLHAKIHFPQLKKPSFVPFKATREQTKHEHQTAH